MIKKHNFIPMEYANNLMKSDLRRCIPTLIVLVAVNILAFQYLRFKMNEIDETMSKSVFSTNEVQVEQVVKPYINIFELRRRISSILRGMEIRSFYYENGKIKIEVLAESERQCIDFIKDIEENNLFEILSLSPIEPMEKFYGLKVELISTGS